MEADALGLEPYVIATAPLLRRIDDSPLGVRLSKDRFYDPTRRRSEAFVDLIDRVDVMTFGPLGMRMPRWAIYDCAELPGAIVGLGGSHDKLPEPLRSEIAPAEFVPFTMCMATPMVAEGHWLVYSISSLLELVPNFDTVATSAETLAIALAMLRVKRATGTIQWGSHRLAAQARFGPLAVRAAWVPAHTHPATCVFEWAVDDASQEQALKPPLASPDGAFPVDEADHPALQRLQARIEGGEELELTGVTPAAVGRAPRALVRWRTA